jgi:putative chitinase
VPDYTQVSFNPNVIPFDLFQKSFEGIGYNRQQAMWPFFNKALEDGNINTCLCKAAFIAQVGHESGGLRYFEEIASGEAYNNRKDLGNGPTDGPTYKGRGPIQLTGKTNYQGASTSIGVDLVADPERVCMPSMGFKTTIYFWNRQNLNQYCQNGGDAEFKSMTKSINGGYNGLDERMARYADARARMGC